MILITDSGSTKCDWIALDLSGKELFKTRTKGLNPAVLPAEELENRISENEELSKVIGQVTQIYFYGAGCGTEKPRLALENYLKSYFKIDEVVVKEDTYAAAYAAMGDEAGVICILGTGSNCSFFDGNEIHQKVVSLGYMLMDQASGNWYGKELIKDYYFNNMPETLKKSFAESYNVDADFIKGELYKSPNPNAYLATHAEFIFQNLEEKYIGKLLRRGLRKFSKNMILQFSEEIKMHKVHFVGSIAHFAEKRIKQVADEFDYEVGNVVRRPIEGLVDYHRKKLTQA